MQFRPMCYHMALAADAASRNGKSPSISEKNSSNDRWTSSSSFIHCIYITYSLVASVVSGENSVKKTLSIAPQFNICEHYLNQFTFIDVLRECPEVIAFFDKLLSMHSFLYIIFYILLLLVCNILYMYVY